MVKRSSGYEWGRLRTKGRAIVFGRRVATTRHHDRDAIAGIGAHV
jgi:hypothetical protein